MSSMQRNAFGVLIVALLFVVGGVIGARWFVGAERERELLAWQTRMSIVIDGRRAAIDNWLSAQFAVIGQIADNEAVQIYTMGLGGSGEPRRDAPQADYLRNFLNMIAQTEKFVDRVPTARIPANVRSAANSGLMIFTQRRQLIAASERAPALDGELADFVNSLAGGSRSIHGPYLGSTGEPLLAIAAPIPALQAAPGTSDPAGYIVAVKEIADELYPLLVQPGETAETAEAQLVRKDGESLIYISPRRDGAKPLSRRLAANTPNLDIAFAVSEPNGFGIRTDYENHKVLIAGRALANAPWTLAYKIDYDEALAALDFRLNAFIASFVLATLLLFTFGGFAWVSGTSRKTEHLANLYRTTSEELARTRDFLVRLRNEDPSPTFAVERDGRIVYANSAFAKPAKLDPDDLVGKTLSQILGPAAAEDYEQAIRETLAGKSTTYRRYERRTGEQTRYIQAKHVFVPAVTGRDDCVLVIEDDVTSSVSSERQRRENQEKVVTALVTMIDQLDPNAKRQSERSAEVAGWIANALDLPAEQCDAVRQGALLANIGKIFLPKDTLLNSATLSNAELNALRSALLKPFELLSDIEFDGPILDMIRLSHRDWSETRGMGTGGDIKLGAQIISVSNAFVALTSDRSYRPARDIEGAFDILLDDDNRRFDRRVVVALVHLFENESGREKWRQLNAED